MSLISLVGLTPTVLPFERKDTLVQRKTKRVERVTLPLATITTTMSSIGGVLVPLEWHEGDVVRKLRSMRQWTLQELSKRSGVNIQVIHRLESGFTREAKRATLEKIANAFGLTERQLRDAIPSSPINTRHTG